MGELGVRQRSAAAFSEGGGAARYTGLPLDKALLIAALRVARSSGMRDAAQLMQTVSKSPHPSSSSSSSSAAASSSARIPIAGSAPVSEKEAQVLLVLEVVLRLAVAEAVRIGGGMASAASHPARL